MHWFHDCSVDLLISPDWTCRFPHNATGFLLDLFFQLLQNIQNTSEAHTLLVVHPYNNYNTAMFKPNTDIGLIFAVGRTNQVISAYIFPCYTYYSTG